MNKHAFRPGTPDGLEARLALSTLASSVSTHVLSPPTSAGGAVHALPRRGRLQETSQFEVRWMREMISHHGMAIQMARVAGGNSSNPEIVSLARGIVRAQTREIGQMQGWLAGWYGVRGVRPVTTADDRAMLHELKTQRGTAFDRAFLSMMIEHHDDAVGDAADCLAEAAHPRLLRLCANIETTQTAEIGQMRRLLAEAGGPGNGGGQHAM